MDEILENKIYRNEILKFHCAAEFWFKFKARNFIAARYATAQLKKFQPEI